MNAQHTPGPWSVVRGDTVIGPKGNSVAECLGYSEKAGDVNQRAQGAREHNARLIASAPELLEALSAIVSMYERGYVRGFGEKLGNAFTDGIDGARKAIAKARGQA